jgi:hypothetical protein
MKLKFWERKAIINKKDPVDCLLEDWHKQHNWRFCHSDYVSWANFACVPDDEEILREGLLNMSIKELSTWADRRVDKVIAKQKEAYLREKAEPILFALKEFFNSRDKEGLK